MPLLRDVLPREFFQGEYCDSVAMKLLDFEVERVHGPGGDDDAPWPGRHRNVRVWWSLPMRRIVGWNENPTLGWTFPCQCLRTPQRNRRQRKKLVPASLSARRAGQGSC